MEALGAQELARSVDCNVPGCTGEVTTGRKYDRGIFAGKCDEHIEAARRDASERGRARYTGNGLSSGQSPHALPLPIPIRPEPVGAPASSLKTVAQKLVPVAAELDRALLRKRAASGEAKRAFDAFKLCFEEIQAAAKDALGQ